MKLSSPTNRPDIDKMLVGIEQTDLLEQELDSSTSYFECFKGVNLVRTEISVMVYLIQVIGGNPLIGYATYFFEQAGLDTSDAFNSEYRNSRSAQIIQAILTIGRSGSRQHCSRVHWYCSLMVPPQLRTHSLHCRDYYMMHSLIAS
jgi:hypothetical protein